MITFSRPWAEKKLTISDKRDENDVEKRADVERRPWGIPLKRQETISALNKKAFREVEAVKPRICSLLSVSSKNTLTDQ